MPFSPPKASELQKSASKQPKAQPLPQDVAVKLRGIDHIIAIDIETNDWQAHPPSSQSSRGGLGQYGFFTILHPDDLLARIVQISWVVGKRSDAEPAIKEFIVRPDGFRISAKATEYHHIAEEQANAEGVPLAIVLREFVDDIRAAVAQGGRVVSHNLE